MVGTGQKDRPLLHQNADPLGSVTHGWIQDFHLDHLQRITMQTGEEDHLMDLDQSDRSTGNATAIVLSQGVEAPAGPQVVWLPRETLTLTYPVMVLILGEGKIVLAKTVEGGRIGMIDDTTGKEID
jgi:hypothetical protein